MDWWESVAYIWSLFMVICLKNKDNKDIKLAEKIGTMSIKHSGDEKFTDIANLYLGADNSVYAKYIDKSNKENSYAYQIDLDKLK